MTDSTIFWLFLIFGYALSMAAEYRIHASNMKYLIHHGATVRGSKVLDWFYRSQLLIVVAAFIEHAGFNPETKALSLLGLCILIAGFVVRHLGIIRLGRLWTRHFILFRRKLVTGGVKGPVWLQRFDIVGRVVEAIGFCLTLQAMTTLTLAAVILPVWALIVFREEIQIGKAEFLDL